MHQLGKQFGPVWHMPRAETAEHPGIAAEQGCAGLMMPWALLVMARFAPLLPPRTPCPSSHESWVLLLLLPIFGGFFLLPSMPMQRGTPFSLPDLEDRPGCLQSPANVYHIGSARVLVFQCKPAMSLKMHQDGAGGSAASRGHPATAVVGAR